MIKNKVNQSIIIQRSGKNISFKERKIIVSLLSRRLYSTTLAAAQLIAL
jgi:hypothetical protein